VEQPKQQQEKKHQQGIEIVKQHGLKRRSCFLLSNKAGFSSLKDDPFGNKNPFNKGGATFKILPFLSL
jgi:hypothetical protein